MYELPDLKQTRFYQESFAEGWIEGWFEGWKEGRIELIKLLIRKGVSLEEIAQTVKLPLDLVEKVALLTKGKED
jgi:predicted transposase YdaD